MAPCRSIVWFVFSLVLVSAPVLGEENKGCQKARSAIAMGRVSDLIKGIKRSTEERDEMDCGDNNSKKSKLTIHQAAVSAIPGQNENENKKKKSRVASDSEHDYLMLPNHAMNVDINLLGIKRHLNKPNKSIRKSPLWSLSKLIEEVDSHETAKKKAATPETNLTKNLKDVDTKSEPSPATIKGVDTKSEPSEATNHKSESSASAISKANLATDPSIGIKATLSKAIEKVEKVIASRNANMITPNKASTTIEDTQAKRNNGTKPKETSTATSKNTSTTTMTGTTKKKVDDPYAEIAAGPDRPKIPELKTGNSGDNEGGPFMKLNDKGDSRQTDKSGPPLTGQHDVGGLLDRLTDKLNKEGGGIASDETAPLEDASQNNVKYMQSSMGLTDSAAAGAAATAGENEDFSQDKQMQEFGLDKLKDQADHNDVQKMTEQDGLLAGNPQQTDIDGLAQGAGFEGDTKSVGGTAALSDQTLANPPSLEGASDVAANVPSAAAALPPSASMETTGETNDDIEKSLSKASSMTTSAIMDVLKNAKLPNVGDFSNADISTGPDPYAAEGEGDTQGGGTSNDPLAALLASKSSDTSALDASDGLNSQSSFGSSEENSHLPDMTDDARSTETSPDMGDEYQRNTIPIDSDDSYRNRYNTELFKRNIIMRPKRDDYVSPFHGKEAFDRAI